MNARKRKLQKEIAKYARLLRKEKRLQYYLSIARLFESAEELQKAEETLKEAAAQFPDLSCVKVALAHILNELDRPQEARALLEPILTKDRDNLLAARRLAESYERSQDFEKALEAYRAILRFRLVGQEVKGQIERLERLVKQIGPKQKEEGQEKEDSEFVGIPTLSLARLHMQQGHHREAVQILNRILQVDPQCEECRWLLAQAEELLKKAETEPADAFLPARALDEFGEPSEELFEERLDTEAAAEPPQAVEEAIAPDVHEALEAEPEAPEEAEAAVEALEEVEEPALAVQDEAPAGPGAVSADSPNGELAPSYEPKIQAKEPELEEVIIFERLKRWLDGSPAAGQGQ